MTSQPEARHATPVISGRPVKPMIIGHRGSPREAPENTIASFERALAHGVDGIELDVHATADGVVVVHHDAVMAPAGSALHAGRAIASLTWRELAAGRGDDMSPAPRLSDVLALIGDRSMAYVEIKGAGIESAVVECIEGARTECAVHAFDHRSVARVRTLAADLRVGILLEARLVDPLSALRDAGATDFWQQWTRIDEDLVAAVHGAGGRVIAWTVNDGGAAAELVRIGVDGICTDVPGEMRRLIAGHA